MSQRIFNKNTVVLRGPAECCHPVWHSKGRCLPNRKARSGTPASRRGGSSVSGLHAAYWEGGRVVDNPGP